MPSPSAVVLEWLLPVAPDSNCSCFLFFSPGRVSTLSAGPGHCACLTPRPGHGAPGNSTGMCRDAQSTEHRAIAGPGTPGGNVQAPGFIQRPSSRSITE